MGRSNRKIMIKEKESDIQKAISDWLQYSKALVVKINNVGIMKVDGSYIPPRQKGISDLIVCYKGRFIALEVKTSKGKLSEPQAEFLAEVVAKGGIGEVVRSIDDVERVIREL